jgi:hypothetical protein
MKKSLPALILLMFVAQISFAQVSVSGRSILVNGNVYKIRGVVYDPIAVGTTRLDGPDYSKVQADITIMQRSCINTIRSYTPINDLSVLNAFAQAGIKIIMGFPNIDDRKIPGPDLQSGSYLSYINTYKNHPAILMWEFGNEYNYHPEWFSGSVKNWYAILNQSTKAAHAADPSHPVATAHGECPDTIALKACPAVDAWGMNLYRYDHPKSVFPQWAAISNKPMYLSEAGADSYDNIKNAVDEQMQARALDSIITDVLHNPSICSGITLFEFTDDWSPSGEPSIHNSGGAAFDVPYDKYGNTEYFGILDVNRTAKAGFAVMKSKYCNTAVVTGEGVVSKESYLSVYPNPVTNGVIDLSASELIEAVSVGNILGETLYSKSVGAVSELRGFPLLVPAGVYFIRVEVGGSVVFRKIVVN